MIVSGTVTKWTLRGTTVPTLMLKLIELRDTFGALLDWITEVRILVFCSVVRLADAPAPPLLSLFSMAALDLLSPPILLSLPIFLLSLPILESAADRPDCDSFALFGEDFS